VLESCKLIDRPHAVDVVGMVGARFGAFNDDVTLDLTPAQEAELLERQDVGWVLLKYLSLICGTNRMPLESVVDDFLIHLLVALGYTKGNLVVLYATHLTSTCGVDVYDALTCTLHVVSVCCSCVAVRSKNRLALEMNTAKEWATADVTVYDVKRRIRVVVMEVCSPCCLQLVIRDSVEASEQRMCIHCSDGVLLVMYLCAQDKPEEAGAKVDKHEPQLIAEAIAAIQANIAQVRLTATCCYV